MTPRIAAFAYYLPQFYPTSLNDHWWGEGFTEWVSVLRAHAGHRSPPGTTVTPGELGFYDLRNAETRAAQSALARESGIDAFCVYHYWSRGERPLPAVEDLILADGQPDIPFFLGWANHNWTLSWKNDPTVTWAQEYDEHLGDTHISWLLDAMDDPRYWTIDGRHVLLVYDPLSVTEIAAVAARWRSAAAERGITLLLLGATRTGPVPDAADIGFDHWVEGTAHVLTAGDKWSRARRSLLQRGMAKRHWRHRDVFWPYAEFARLFRETLADYPRGTIPLVLTGWNNVGRRTWRAGTTDVTPAKLREAVAAAAALAPTVGDGDGAVRLLALNAWNEWGEGMTIEPSTEFGRDMLHAVRDGLADADG